MALVSVLVRACADTIRFSSSHPSVHQRLLSSPVLLLSPQLQLQLLCTCTSTAGAPFFVSVRSSQSARQRARTRTSPPQRAAPDALAAWLSGPEKAQPNPCPRRLRARIKKGREAEGEKNEKEKLSPILDPGAVQECVRRYRRTQAADGQPASLPAWGLEGMDENRGS
ncbi:hypothetical protein HDV57DRAFT_186647 [Trichoderma longibrachiatum]